MLLWGSTSDENPRYVVVSLRERVESTRNPLSHSELMPLSPPEWKAHEIYSLTGSPLFESSLGQTKRGVSLPRLFDARPQQQSDRRQCRWRNDEHWFGRQHQQHHARRSRLRRYRPIIDIEDTEPAMAMPNTPTAISRKPPS